MEQFRYPLKNNASINRWRTGSVKKTPFSSPFEKIDVPPNYGEDGVRIVYPVRKFFLASHDLSGITLPRGPFPLIYFPFERSRVDFSSFIHTPTHLEIEAISWVDAPLAGSYPFEVYTNGAIKLWLNGVELLSFAPFTRSNPGKQEILFPFNKGLNELRIYADDIAEREVFFSFELKYIGQSCLEGVLLLDEGVEEISRAERFLKSCYFPKDCFYDGDVILHHDPAVPPLLLFLARYGAIIPAAIQNEIRRLI